MKILIFTLGSRGDVQPYLALAVGLQQAGHRVTLIAPETWTEWIESYGVAAHPVQYDPAAAMLRPEARAVLEGRNPLRQFSLMQDVMKAGAVEAMDEFWQAAQAADLVIQSGTGGGGVEAATQFHIPLVYAYVLPFPPTRAFSAFFLPPQAGLGGRFNRQTHALAQSVLWRGLSAPLINRWRTQRLSLPAWRSYAQMFAAGRALNTPWLFGYSPSVLPKPPDWEAYHHVTGYWFLDPPAAWQPPAELAQFLEAGPAPVYVGFGSLGSADPRRTTQLVLQALALAGQRGVLLTGAGGLTREPAPANVYYVDNVPHDWLLPHMAAVVHHGGAGTTAAGLRAGVPSVLTPFVGDQWAWANVVAQAGVGPRVGGMKGLTAEKLAQALGSAVHDTGLRARAAALGASIRAENGVANAVALIEAHAAAFQAGRTPALPA